MSDISPDARIGMDWAVAWARQTDRELRAPNRAITVWKDGTWKLWSDGDAYYAQNDSNWLATIPLKDIDL